MPVIVIQEVNKSVQTKGKAKWTVLDVTYTDNGKNFTKKVLSFANPAVFEVMQNATQGDNFDVTVTKDGEYYNWSSAMKISKEAAAASTPNPPGQGRVLGSNYETADERKIKQLYIIKQSSISNAIEYMDAIDASYEVDELLEVAQRFVDYVYGTDEAVASVDSAD